MSDEYRFGFTGWLTEAPKEQGTEQPPPLCTGTKDGSHCWVPSGVIKSWTPVECCEHCTLTRWLVSVEKTYSYSGGG